MLSVVQQSPNYFRPDGSLNVVRNTTTFRTSFAKREFLEKKMSVTFILDDVFINASALRPEMTFGVQRLTDVCLSRSVGIDAQAANIVD